MTNVVKHHERLKQAEGALIIELQKGKNGLNAFIYSPCVITLPSQMCSCSRRQQTEKHVHIISCRLSWAHHKSRYELGQLLDLLNVTWVHRWTLKYHLIYGAEMNLGTARGSKRHALRRPYSLFSFTWLTMTLLWGTRGNREPYRGQTGGRILIPGRLFFSNIQLAEAILGLHPHKWKNTFIYLLKETDAGA